MSSTKSPLLICGITCLALLSSVASAKPPKEQNHAITLSPSNSKKASNEEYPTTDWTRLLPIEDLIASIPAGDDFGGSGFNDPLANSMRGSFDAELDEDYRSSLNSTKFNMELNGKKVRLPGFIVPLEFQQEQVVTEFLLVPYFGACIHVPPPPPNQIVYVKTDKGIKLTNLEQAYWLSGTLSAKLKESELGTAAYTLDLAKHEIYQ